MLLTADFKGKSKSVQLPTTWDELYPYIHARRSLRIKVCAAVLALSDNMLRLAIAVHFIKKTGWMRHVQAHYIDHVVRNMDIRFDNLMPVHISAGFSFFGVRYTMVKPDMENVSMREFIFADEYLQDYIAGDPKALFYLTALLCRRDTDARIRTRKELDVEVAFLERYAASLLFGRRIVEVMASSFLCILFAKQYIKSTYLPQLGTGGEQPGIHFGFHNIVMDIAENGAFGDMESTYDTMMHDIFVFCIKKKQDHDRSQTPTP